MTGFNLSVGGKLFCLSCQCSKDREGGVHSISPDGRRRKWRCAMCTAKAKQRRAEIKAKFA